MTQEQYEKARKITSKIHRLEVAQDEIGVEGLPEGGASIYDVVYNVVSPSNYQKVADVVNAVLREVIEQELKDARSEFEAL